jgi:hypothetical protein
VADDRASALLVRVWLEGPGVFRARLTTLVAGTEESPVDEATVAVASSPREVLDAVRDWLDDVIGDATDRGGGAAAGDPVDSDGSTPPHDDGASP